MEESGFERAERYSNINILRFWHHKEQSLSKIPSEKKLLTPLERFKMISQNRKNNRNIYFKTISVFFVVIFIQQAKGQHYDGVFGNAKKCAGFNEYCQNNWECCSNLCMSYLYKCTGKNQNSPHPIFGFNQQPAQSSLAEIMNLHFGYHPVGRIASSHRVETENNEGPTTSPNFDARRSRYYDYEDALNFAELSQFGNKLDEKLIRKRQSEPTTDESKQSSTQPIGDCLPIGAKCYKNNECCTARCHGFLHQCVT